VFRIYFPELDIDIQNEDRDFLLDLVKRIKEGDFVFQSLEWIDKQTGLERKHVGMEDMYQS